MRAYLTLRVPPLLLLALALALQGWLAPSQAARGVWQWLLALALLGLSGGVALAAAFAFRRARTTVDPRQPHSSSALLTHGVYAWTRNPMYLAFAGILLAQTVYLGWPLGLLWVMAFIWYLTEFQIKPEEAALTERFGAAYEAYLRRVRRWC
ncbi:MAG: isoprenylcysteine carboxylmethyltransferase family protein [Neisseriaceae bacterium]|nr:isoprenylcysteine carboxylmethyltransferase family protein [Neisseriaceae bacterium]MBP6862991.1 isoprenylcysteine carboxylmethyltransferase family protein [Neisseriaceae bacterium]